MPARRAETLPGAVLLAPTPLGLVARLRLAGEIATTYARARHALRRAPLRRAVTDLRAVRGGRTRLRPADRTAEVTLLEARCLGRAVARTLALLPGDTRCLTRSLVLSALLARRSIPGQLVLGARTEPSFLAHAWVECGGVPVLDPGDGSFGRLVEI